jgi:hypothetical protein
LCHSPQERLYFDGLWRDGGSPRTLGSAADMEQFARFDELIAQWAEQHGADGRRAFALPVDSSSGEPRWRALDRIDMRAWLLEHGLTSALLHWSVDYATRDDYGAAHGDVSAWAGLNYFCARGGLGGGEAAEHKTVLTWPQGNAWIGQRLARLAGERLMTGALVRRVAPAGASAAAPLTLDCELSPAMAGDAAGSSARRPLRIQARAVIWAAPLAVAARVIDGLDPARTGAATSVPTSAWLVANLTLAQPPAEQGRAGMAWDNVLYGEPSLGYVDAGHQRLARQRQAKVLTWYRPLSEHAPERARALLRDFDARAWARTIIAELSRPHPDFAQQLRAIDFWRWPHAMPRPVPGALWGMNEAGARRLWFAQPWRGIHFAHCDASGLSLFEEAVERGVRCAAAIISA